MHGHTFCHPAEPAQTCTGDTAQSSMHADWYLACHAAAAASAAAAAADHAVAKAADAAAGAVAVAAAVMQ